MRYLIFLLAPLILFCNNLEISSNNFYYKDGDKKAVFSGNAIAKEGKNVINADKIVVFLDENNEAKKYLANGNVKFEIFNKKRHLKGKCNFFTYYPELDKYILKGDAVLKDIINNRVVYGDEIVIDNKKSESYAKGSRKKPVKFIFKIKSKK